MIYDFLHRRSSIGGIWRRLLSLPVHACARLCTPCHTQAANSIVVVAAAENCSDMAFEPSVMRCTIVSCTEETVQCSCDRVGMKELLVQAMIKTHELAQRVPLVNCPAEIDTHVRGGEYLKCPRELLADQRGPRITKRIYLQRCCCVMEAADLWIDWLAGEWCAGLPGDNGTTGCRMEVHSRPILPLQPF